METVSIVIMNHGQFGEQLLASAQMVIGEIENAKAISLMPGMSIEDYCTITDEAISTLPGKVIVLTDLFGGTPCNVAMMMSQKYDLRIICGVNFPMLIELVSSREMIADIDELVENVMETAKNGVFKPSLEYEQDDDFC